MKPHLRVMIDMTTALGERAGIPQVARQTAWLLAQDTQISTSALYLSLHGASEADRYNIKRMPPLSARDDAEYLADLLGHSKRTGGKFFHDIRQLLRVPQMAANPLIPFEPKLFNDVIWENYFAPTLPPRCREFLSQVDQYRSPLSRAEILMRLRSPFPLAKLDTSGFDFIIFQNPTAVRVSSHTTKIIRLHDLVPLLRFDTQPPARHIMQDFYQALSCCVKDSYFACVSESTRNDLISLFPKAESRAFVISNSVTPPVIETAASTCEPGESYFLAVGTIEPRKNYRRLIEAFRTYRNVNKSSHRLTIVGHSGWQNSDIIQELENAQSEGWLTWRRQATPGELSDLYRNAFAVVTASVQEGFGMPPVEAATFGTPSVLSSLPVFKAHFGDSADYFDPYDPNSMAQALTRMTSLRRAQLSGEAREKARQFEPQEELRQWQQFFYRLASQVSEPYK